MLEITVYYAKINFDWKGNDISLDDVFLIENGKQSAKGIDFEDIAFKSCDFASSSEAISDMKSTCYLNKAKKDNDYVNVSGIVAYYTEYDTEYRELAKTLYCGFDFDCEFKEISTLQ
ncbi:MAG: hypothetical protein MJ120_00250 [Clostridia bacterium]|nr:hypothetical protein [Clostridia bacterium]